MAAIIYTKPNCPYCIQAKHLMAMQGVQFTETVIGQDIVREDFMATFPEAKTVPLIFIDNMKVGGYEQLREYFDNKPQFLQD